MPGGTRTHTVQAFNTATASTNKIHDDTVAKDLGFRGGLVPGVDVFAYLCHLPTEAWGSEWLQRGTIAARFVSPVYDGDEVTVTATPTDDGGLDLSLTDPRGAECARGHAALPDDAPEAPSIGDWPDGPVPDSPPPASATSLTASPLGRLEVGFRSGPAQAYLDDVRETHPVYRNDGCAHPGWLLRYANYVLSSNVVLGPWIHVESAVQLHGIVGDGDRVETRAVVLDVRERSGHHLVDLDVLQHVGDRVVARTTHTAIYQPRGTY